MQVIYLVSSEGSVNNYVLIAVLSLQEKMREMTSMLTFDGPMQN